MTVVTFGSNIASLKAQRQLGKATADVRSVSERLSSGLRINHASDDAAGLSIASSLNADRRVFEQGVRNLNDGISLLNVADGATEQLSSILIRLKELAEQAANGTYGATQRKALDSEAQALSKEYFRIVQTTSFNGQSLFSPAFGQLRLQGGYGENGAISGTLGGAVGNGTFGTQTSQGGSLYQGDSLFAFGDINGDGILDRVLSGSVTSVSFGRGDGTFQAGQSFAFDSTNVLFADFNNDGWLDIVMGDDTSSSIALGNGNGSFRIGANILGDGGAYSIAAADFNGDGNVDLLRDGELSLGLGNGTFGAASSPPISGYSFTVGDLNSDGIADVIASTTDDVSVFLGQRSGVFLAAQNYNIGYGRNFGGALGDLNGDGKLDFAQTTESGIMKVLFGRGDGTFGASTTFIMDQIASDDVSLGDINGDGLLDIVSAGTTNTNTGSITIRLGNGDGTFRASTSFTVQSSFPDQINLVDLNGDGVLDIASAGSNEFDAVLGNTTSGIGPLVPFSLRTRADSLQAMSQFDSALKRINTQRGTIGALQSRILTGVANLQSSTENYASAASRITDADFALESANLVRARIIQFASTSVLAQANSQPQLLLRLLTDID